MGGTSHVIQAHTVKELERKTREWARRTWASNLEVDVGWDRKRVRKTAAGYSISVHAHP
jgi:hypothetical protein